MALEILIYLAVILVCTQGVRVIYNEPLHHQRNATAAVPDKFISGGYPAEIDQFPWIARLAIRDAEGSTYLCAGSLINPKFVLTAAHCIDDVTSNKDIDIYLGDYDRSTYPKDCVRDKCTKNWKVNPNKIIKHREYDPTSLSNDIALLRLKKKAYIKTIPLTPFNIDKQKNKGMAVAVTGWGKTEDQVTSNVLLTTEISMIPKNYCPSDVPRNHLCAGDANGKDTCPGDSGGPLLMYHDDKYYLAGVVSYGPDRKCGTSKMGYYTNVYMYKKWIRISMITSKS